MTERRLGISGRLAATFQNHALTPVLALAALLLGLVAVLITPREEEPQIDVTMANVFVALPGSPADEVERLVAVPLQQAMSAVEGVKHVYAVSQPGVAVVTVEFDVGIARQDALVRLYNQVFANGDLLPQALGAGPPLVKPMGIDDVPVMAVTLWTDDPALGAIELGQVARTLETELQRVPGTRELRSIGAPRRAVLVTLDPDRLAARGLTPGELAQALAAANVVQQAGERVDAKGTVLPVTVGEFLATRDDVADLVIGLDGGKPLRLADVAEVRDGADLPTSYVWHAQGAGAAVLDGPIDAAPAVTLSIGKKPGANAADITREVRARLASLEAGVIPDGVRYTVTRDYGATANDKATTLIKKLMFATMAVVLLVLFALGWREAIVVGAAVILTLAVTLFASWAMGFTINRVSLFALIFSIGILVDDAIVVVENIHRHMMMGKRSLREALPAAVDEIGGPTILATFTVIAALLPMAFVTGLMGPYMRPIPINASVGMVLSLLIALTVTPWLAVKLLARRYERLGDQAGSHGGLAARLHGLFDRLMRPFLDAAKGRRRRGWLFVGIGGALALSLGLVLVQAVVLKMLPFDNKSEFQVVVDLPEGTPLEGTNALLVELAAHLRDVPEVADVQAYAGTSAPVNFNGLVRQYFLREGANVGDLQVNLVDRQLRARNSHDIARAERPPLQAIAARHGAALKVVEVPPGPPVLSPLVAEVYGPDEARVRELALHIAELARGTDGIVDVDTTVVADSEREQWVINRGRAARLGVSQQAITQTLAMAVGGIDATFLRDGAAQQAMPVHLRLPAADQADAGQLLTLNVRADSGALVPLAELVTVRRAPWEASRMQKDLLPVVYVLADEAGALDSPLYGMFDVVGQLRDAALPVAVSQHFFRAPDDALGFAVKWDGEWQVTWQTFRDMGVAYIAGLLLIYLLIVAQFRSYLLPLIIMAPIPLTAIGVMPGHALLGAQFTATSMIGMIALAGIIVRNSILLVDFIRHEQEAGRDLADAVVDACAVRAQPIALTALAAMLGALFILDDPIFNGLAVSLIFGIAVSTLLTLVVIPLLYFAWQNGRAKVS